MTAVSDYRGSYTTPRRLAYYAALRQLWYQWHLLNGYLAPTPVGPGQSGGHSQSSAHSQAAQHRRNP